MKSRAELLREAADQPERLVEYITALQEQLGQELEQARAELRQKVEQLAQAQAIIAELKRELFGAKADKLNPQQEQQLQQLVADVQEQNQGAAPLSQEVLQEVLTQERTQQLQRAKERRRRQLPPVELEKQQVILEPDDRFCPESGQLRPRIGQEVTTEYDYLPAKLIIREIVRPKYGRCHQPCCQGISIAPLPPRLVPQSKLGLGLAVHLLLSRFDDHVSYYTLERNFLERFGAVIPRQQMVQWVEKVAHLLLAIYGLIAQELTAGDYLQIDESPVKVLDPEVKGKAAQGYLWFYSRPGGYVFLEFHQSRGRDAPRQRLQPFHGTMQTMVTSSMMPCNGNNPASCGGSVASPIAEGAFTKRSRSPAPKACGSSGRCANSTNWSGNSRTPPRRSVAGSGWSKPRPSGWP
jgi:transposase